MLERAATTPKARLILSSIVQLARQLGCVTVAEQVDQPGLVDVARDLGIDWLQGDLAGKTQRGG